MKSSTKIWGMFFRWLKRSLLTLAKTSNWNRFSSCQDKRPILYVFLLRSTINWHLLVQIFAVMGDLDGILFLIDLETIQCYLAIWILEILTLSNFLEKTTHNDRSILVFAVANCYLTTCLDTSGQPVSPKLSLRSTELFWLAVENSYLPSEIVSADNATVFQLLCFSLFDLCRFECHRW